MNISREKIDDLNEVINLKIGSEDYSEKVDVALKDYRKKARIDGFRPGMVPMGLIKKLYYKPVLAEEINKMVSENLLKYIRDEKIRILGEPLPHSNEKQIDFDKDTEFEFSFDIGLYPEFTASVSDNDKIDFYEIKIDEQEIEKTLADVSKRFGELVPAEEVTGNEYLKGNLYQSDAEGTLVENGISVEDASISLDIMKDDDIRKLFTGAKAGDKITFDLKTAYPNNTDLSSLLKITKEEAEAVKGLFTFEIKEIQVFKDHEINQGLFDKVYGEGQVSSEEDFRQKIREELAHNYQRESEYKFSLDAKEYFINKAKIDLPIDFLKRWMIETNKNITAEQVEKDISEYEDDFKWQIIKDQIVKENEITASEEEVFEFSRAMTRNQFYGYGLHNIPEDYIDQYSREQLAKKDAARKIYDQLLEQKAYRFIQESVKLEKKEVKMDEFKKLFEK